VTKDQQEALAAVIARLWDRAEQYSDRGRLQAFIAEADLVESFEDARDGTNEDLRARAREYVRNRYKEKVRK